MAHSVAGRQLMPISTGGSKYHPMTWGEIQLEKIPPRQAPENANQKNFFILFSTPWNKLVPDLKIVDISQVNREPEGEGKLRFGQVAPFGLRRFLLSLFNIER
jgi:hypothetical protein